MEENKKDKLLADVFNSYMDFELQKVPDKEALDNIHQFSAAFEQRLMRVVHKKHVGSIMKKGLLTAAGLLILIGITVPIIVGVKRSNDEFLTSEKSGDTNLASQKVEIKLEQEQNVSEMGEESANAQVTYQVDWESMVAAMPYTNIYEEDITIDSTCKLEEWDGENWNVVGNGSVNEKTIEAGKTETLSIHIALEYSLDTNKSYQLQWRVGDQVYNVPVDINIKK